MKLIGLCGRYGIAKLPALPETFPIGKGICALFTGGGEISVVAENAAIPANATARETDYRAFRVAGCLDFSMTGILAELTEILRAESIPTFALSTYDTDYLFVKSDRYDRATAAFCRAGHPVEDENSEALR